MRNLTEIRQMKKELRKEIIRGNHWFVMALDWVLGNRNDIIGFRLSKAAQRKPIEQKVRQMMKQMMNGYVWRASYFIKSLEWVLGEREDIFGYKMSTQGRETVVF